MDEEYSTFDFLKDIVEAADRRGKEDREKEIADKGAKTIRVWYSALCDAGFSKDEAFDILLALLGSLCQ